MIKSLQSYWFRVRSKDHYYRYSTKNPKWLLMFVFGRFALVRSIVYLLSKGPLIKKYGKNHSIFQGVNADDVVEFLRRDGFFLNISLPKDVLKEVLHFTSYTSCYGNKSHKLCFPHAEKKQAEAEYGMTFIQGDYYNVSSLCPAVKRVESDPLLLEIATKYLNAEPVHIETRLWWSFVAESSLHEQMNAAQTLFHYDLDDYRSIKFYFHLTDVDLSSGPHVSVRGSHKKKKLAHQFSLFIGRSDKDILDYYGIKDVVAICGEAGFGFVEDTFCFHKGTPPTCRDRLMINVEFAVNTYEIKNKRMISQSSHASEVLSHI